MPHIVIEYSREIANKIDIVRLMTVSLEAAAASEVMRREDIKVRAMPYEHYLLADGGDSFVHTTVRMLSGRSDPQKYHLSSLLRERQVDLLNDVHDLSVHSVSIDIVDMNPDAYLKRLL